MLGTFPVAFYVDNGLDLDRTAVIRDARAAVASSGAKLRVVDPEHPEAPITPGAGVTLTPIVPTAWPAACSGDPNACSIALRIDYCKSSVLFTGDAPREEEEVLDTRGEVTLLQVGHHGSKTSTGDAFLRQTKPKYAVISAAKPGEGTNDGYCHPRAVTVETLTWAMGGSGARTVKAFDGAVRCRKGEPQAEHWLDVSASDRFWVTARDGVAMRRKPTQFRWFCGSERDRKALWCSLRHQVGAVCDPAPPSEAAVQSTGGLVRRTSLTALRRRC